MKIIKTRMRGRAVWITPEEAQALLDRNHPDNRNPKKGRILTYQRDMEADVPATRYSVGLWTLTHQAVAIDEDGRLVDGQNRLTACVRSGKPIPIFLVTNVPRRSMIAVDAGATRNVADAAKVSGSALPRGRGLGWSAVARRMAKGNEAQRVDMSIPKTLLFIKAHWDALAFAFSLFPKEKKGLTSAPIKAVLARAYYTQNRERIKEFASILISGLPKHIRQDAAVIALRNYLQDALTVGKRKVRVNVPGHLIYAKVESALIAFLAHEPLDKLYGTSEELFPLPEESE